VTASNASPPPDPPEPGEPEPGGLFPVFLLNATRTSGGVGPGPVRLPRAEAGALTAARLAIGGDRPPVGWPG
jgi:hypothetical protein